MTPGSDRDSRSGRWQRWRNSARLRVAVALLLLQAVTFAVMVTGFILWRILQEPLDNYGTALLFIAAIESVERGPDQSLVLPPDSKAAMEIAAHPGAWLVMSDGIRSMQVGTPPANSLLVEKLAEMRRTGRPLQGMHRYGLETKAGWLTLEAGGLSLGWRDWGWVLADTWDVTGEALLFVFLPLALVAGLTVPMVARHALRPITRAAEAAAAIDPAQPGRRLPQEGMATEALVLIDAVNAALARLEAARDRERRFIADAAHELRTPIAILRTRLDGLPDSPLKAELLRDVRRLGDLAHHLLELERAARTPAERPVVDLTALAREVCSTQAPLVLASGHDIAFLAGPEPVPVRGDRMALARALGNLLDNAMKHGGAAGQITVSVLAPAVIRVEDQGPGFPPDLQPRLFEAWVHGRGSGTGAGLGLYLVQQITAAHGGQVRVLPGHGARIEMALPLATL